MVIATSQKKNVKKAEEILIETGLLDESSELKLNLSVEDVFGTEPLQQNEQNEIETVEIGTDPYQQNDEPVVKRFSTENQSKPFHSFPDLRSK